MTFQRVGKIDPLSVWDYQDHGGFVGLVKALDSSSQDLVSCIRESGLRGRGGSSFSHRD